MKSIAKEIFLMALLVMIVVFMIGMVFYQYMPNNKTVPNPVQYSTDSTTAAVIQEISAATGFDNMEDGEEIVEDVIKSYSIGTKELTTAATKQTYISGKTDPFAVYNENQTTDDSDGNAVTNTTTNSNKTTDSSNTTGTSNAGKTDTNSTGTFFEKSNSK